MPASPATASGSTPGCQSTTACPSTSIPRRPARPVSWVYSPGVRSACVLAVPLVQPLDDHRPGRHVDAQGQRLGGEHGADQPGLEQFLDYFLEGGQHPGVVRRDPALQPGQPLGVAQHRQVGLGDVPGAPLGDLGDGGRLVRGGQPQPASRHCRTAASQPARLKMNVMAGSSPAVSSRAMTSGRRGARNRAGRRAPRRAARCLARGPVVPPGQPEQFRVHLRALAAARPIPGAVRPAARASGLENRS